MNKNLGPFLGKEKINYLPLQDSLQKILDGQFNNAEEARKYSPKNIYEKYVKRVNELYSQAAEDMKEIFKEVRKIYIPPRTSLADEKSDADTDSQSEKLDIAQGEKSESDEETEQKRKGLKILTPKQMVTRLPILLAQLKAGNNSQNLKHDIGQIAYSLYRSKILSKLIYNNLINTI